MNDKIRKLYEEAKSFYLTDEYILEPSKEDCELIGEKFAELIVRECAELCLNNETFQGMFHSMEYRKGRHFNTMIKAHFGVEK